LIFDFDGVLVDAERDDHRVAFNQAFAAKGLDVVWDVLYGELQIGKDVVLFDRAGASGATDHKRSPGHIQDRTLHGPG
jgi:beta-phosphoglucomutase-like phosphatase (HAD superfamily)